MFDALNPTDRRLLKDSLEARAGELHRQLNVNRLQFTHRKVALADHRRLQELIAEVSRAPRLSIAAEQVSEHLAEYSGERVFAADADL